MEFHSPFMGCFYHERQWIVVGLGCYSLFAAEEFAPGGQCAWIKGISCGSYLDKYRVHSHCFQLFEQLNELCTLLFRASVWGRGPVDVVHRGNPGAPHFLERGFLGNQRLSE